MVLSRTEFLYTAYDTVILMSCKQSSSPLPTLPLRPPYPLKSHRWRDLERWEPNREAFLVYSAWNDVRGKTEIIALRYRYVFTWISDNAMISHDKSIDPNMLLYSSQLLEVNLLSSSSVYTCTLYYFLLFLSTWITCSFRHSLTSLSLPFPPSPPPSLRVQQSSYRGTWESRVQDPANGTG